MSSQEEASLTLKDRINFPYILANQILTFQKSILAFEYSEQKIRESIEGFVRVIPNAWKDEQFKKDMEEAKVDRKVDTRPNFCGMPASEKFCKMHKIEIQKEEKVLDYYKVFQACIDLLNRRGMVSKINRIEELESIDIHNLTPKEISDLENLNVDEQ